jgi:hypothetical protein
MSKKQKNELDIDTDLLPLTAVERAALVGCSGEGGSCGGGKREK